MMKTKIKGQYGATYIFEEDHLNVEVEKKDGKKFFIPLQDFFTIVGFCERKQLLKEAEKEFVNFIKANNILP